MLTLTFTSVVNIQDKYSDKKWFINVLIQDLKVGKGFMFVVGRTCLKHCQMFSVKIFCYLTSVVIENIIKNIFR